jgi:hypothetical protein
MGYLRVGGYQKDQEIVLRGMVKDPSNDWRYVKECWWYEIEDENLDR